MSLKNPRKLKKMLRKSPASNVWAAIFKKADFFLMLFKSYRIECILAFFSNLNFFLSSLLMVVPSSVNVKRLKYGHAEFCKLFEGWFM